MADLPIELDAGLAEHLARVVDVEGRIPRALQSLGPVTDRDVILVDGRAGIRARQLTELGARVTLVDSSGPALFDAPDASADVVIGCWSAFRDARPGDLAQAARLLRAGGRLLVVHDYGRDDIASLRGDLPEYGAWSHRGGPFLRQGFKIRVVHSHWTFDDAVEMRAFLMAVFGDVADALVERLPRPRLTYNIAVYHRTFDEVAS